MSSQMAFSYYRKLYIVSVPMNSFNFCRLSKKVRSASDNATDADVMTRSGSEAHPLSFGERLTVLKSSQNTSPSHENRATLAQTNWNFVEKLLKVAKYPS